MNQADKKHRAGFLSHESAFILFNANTYRIGTTQTAEVTVTVHRLADPKPNMRVEVWRCQILTPVKGKEVPGRRTDHVDLSESWQIDSDSDAAMKDFSVKAFVSDQLLGDMESTVTFKYSEMGK